VRRNGIELVNKAFGESREELTLRITLAEGGKWLRISLTGRFDIKGAATVSEAVEKALSQGQRFVELDMSGVDYLSSAGIRALLVHHRNIGHLKGAFYLTGVQERVMRILEMAGLYDLLLADPLTAHDEHPAASTIDLSGWKVQDFILDNAVLVPKFIGEPCHKVAQDKAQLACEVVAFPASTLSVGIGALGYEDAHCRDRFGLYIAAGGIAAYKPFAPDLSADYVAYAEAYVPSLYAVSGLAMSGNFSHLISFECTKERSVGFPDVAETMLRIQGKPAVGFVIAAECGHRVLLACGVVGISDKIEMRGWTSPLYDRATLFGHTHAASFPYQPLRLGS
jgi:anti-anti-sigma factor